MKPLRRSQRSLFAVLSIVFAFATDAAAQGVGEQAKVLAEHPQVGRRVDAARALGDALQTGADGALAALGKAISSDPAPEVRAAATTALGRAKSCESVWGPLSRALSDASSLVRGAADLAATSLRCPKDSVALRPAAGATAAPTTAPSADKARATDAVLRSHLLYGSTAHAIPQGTASWNIANLGAWEFGYALRDDLHFSVLTAPPIGALAVRPQLRFSFGSETLRGAVLFEAGTVIPYYDNGVRDSLGMVGGGGIITLGGTKNFFSAGVFGYGVFARQGSAGLILLSAGGQFELSERLRFAVEGWIPIIPELARPVEAGVLFYGLKILGGRLYGSVGFAYFFAPGVYSLYKYLPLGIPLLQFGFTW